MGHHQGARFVRPQEQAVRHLRRRADEGDEDPPLPHLRHAEASQAALSRLDQIRPPILSRCKYMCMPLRQPGLPIPCNFRLRLDLFVPQPLIKI